MTISQVLRILDRYAKLHGVTPTLGQTVLKAPAKLRGGQVSFHRCRHSHRALAAGQYLGVDFVGRDAKGKVHYVGLNLQSNKHRGKITYGRNTPYHVKTGTPPC